MSKCIKVLFIGTQMTRILLIKTDFLKTTFKFTEGISCENEIPSPDCNGNPFLFFFKNEKIAVESWK